MNIEHLARPVTDPNPIAQWEAMLRDEAALLDHPGSHHKALLVQAYALHRDHIIDRGTLSDFLEQADGALAYAIEALFDRHSGE
ncbi:hypothetical protein [Pseudomonas gingeri]|uniref:hypothetical protein n=1 Tax=Pseudomonas gingeri TaxID=117681 RepID=UPI0015BD5DE2|nr:hypothetical protein [Pseudomonas gingeri]NWD47803.1 hypothetical protein [Pseudomonas gingeri]